VSQEVIKVLLVEDNLDYASMLQLLLNVETPGFFKFTHTTTLAETQHALPSAQFDIILLDLFLPDSQGFATFAEIYPLAEGIPIVVLTALDDKALAIQAVREGAQDYLIKGGIEGPQLSRALRYAIERQQTLTRLQRLSLIDELTGLFNRRGFMSLAKQHLKIARRAGRSLVLLFCDLDDLKGINDRFGHAEGDKALRAIANILKASFRSSDVIGRIGGDEFTVLAINTNGHSEDFIHRIQEGLQHFNTLNPAYAISLSIGVARFDPTSETTLEELLLAADTELYQNKQDKIG
jgi:diguanylate cyclase (GGDEF)-like protein